MSIDSVKNHDKKEAEAYSYADEHSIVYKWKITGITSFINSARNSDEDIQLNSPEFSTGARIKDLWRLQLKFTKNDKSSKKKSWISLYLVTNNKDRNIRTKFRLFYFDKNNRKMIKNIVYESYKRWDRFFISPVSDKWGLSDLIEIDKLFEKKNELLENDTLTVGVDLTVFDDYIGVNSIDLSRNSKRKLTDDFEDLFVSKKNCDVIIRVSDEEFDAHKFILTTRSRFFDAMFSHNMKENNKNEVTVPDIDPGVFKKVLNYIYTDQVNDLDYFAEELLEASDKYQLQGLKEMCEDSLAKSLTVENAIRILILADRHDAKLLKELTINYVVGNFFRFKSTEEFKALDKNLPSLFLDVLKKYSDVETKLLYGTNFSTG